MINFTGREQAQVRNVPQGVQAEVPPEDSHEERPPDGPDEPAARGRRSTGSGVRGATHTSAPSLRHPQRRPAAHPAEQRAHGQPAAAAAAPPAHDATPQRIRSQRLARWNLKPGVRCPWVP